MDFLGDLLVLDGRVFALAMVLVGAVVLVAGGNPWFGAPLVGIGLLSLAISWSRRRKRKGGTRAAG